jgi:uncharacterized protein (DUF58 family)
MTQRAFGVLLAGVALIMLQLLVGAAPLLIVGPAFVLLGALTLVYVLAALHGTGVRRRGLPPRVTEDQPLEATIELQVGPLGAPGAALLDPLEREPIPVRRTGGPLGSRRSEVRFATSLPRRGLFSVEPPSLLLSDPLGLVKGRKSGEGHAQQMLVLPRTEQIRWRQEDGEPPAPTRARSTLEPLAAVDVDGLRPYRPGAPASRIHWQALARGAGLLERRLRSDGHELPLVMLDPRGDGPPEQLDAAVRAAASLILELARHGGCRAVIGGERRAATIGPELAGWPALHARLAVLEGGQDAPAPALSERAPGGLLYVAARRLEGPPRSLTQGAGTRVLVVPAELAEGLTGGPSFDVTGCRGFVLRSGVARAAA